MTWRRWLVSCAAGAVLLSLGAGAARSRQAAATQPIPSPQGTATENGLAGYAKILCSAVFVSGRAPEDGAQGSAYFFMPAAERNQVKWTVDRDAKLVRASLGAITREARFYGDQGCIIQNPSRPGIHFTPVAVKTTLPDAMTLCDRLAKGEDGDALARDVLEAALQGLRAGVPPSSQHPSTCLEKD